jgi:hypothetical protein
MKIRPLCGILTAAALIAPAAPAAAGAAAPAGSVGSTVHRNEDDAALRAALTAVVDAGGHRRARPGGRRQGRVHSGGRGGAAGPATAAACP